MLINNLKKFSKSQKRTTKLFRLILNKGVWGANKFLEYTAFLIVFPERSAQTKFP